jgi:hypothetical protein
MGEQHRIQLYRRNRQWRPVPQAQQLVSLKQATVDHQAFAIVHDQVLGACDCAGSAEKRDAHPHVDLLQWLDATADYAQKNAAKLVKFLRHSLNFNFPEDG